MRMRIGNVAQLLPGKRDHFVGDIDAVDLDKVPAHRTHQPARAASDLQRAPVPTLSERHAAQLPLQTIDNLGRGGEKLGVVRLAAAEGNVMTGVLAGARVPILPDPGGNFGIAHITSGSSTGSD